MSFTAFVSLVYFEDLEIIQTQQKRPNNTNGKLHYNELHTQFKFLFIWGQVKGTLSQYFKIFLPLIKLPLLEET